MYSCTYVLQKGQIGGMLCGASFLCEASSLCRHDRKNRNLFVLSRGTFATLCFSDASDMLIEGAVAVACILFAYLIGPHE